MHSLSVCPSIQLFVSVCLIFATTLLRKRVPPETFSSLDSACSPPPVACAMLPSAPATPRVLACGVEIHHRHGVNPSNAPLDPRERRYKDPPLPALSRPQTQTTVLSETLEARWAVMSIERCLLLSLN